MDKVKYPKLAETIATNTTIDLADTIDRELIRELQILLNLKGFNAGEPDGIPGVKTINALARAKNALSLQYPRLVGKTTLDRLYFMVPISTFALPTGGMGRLTSGFGPRMHPITKVSRPHRGIDIGADRGTPVFAVAAGMVGLLVSGCRGENNSCGGGFGNYVRLTHINNSAFTETVYAHLLNVMVRPGESVEKGQQIGTVGSTGRSTGPHLHFETWRGGRAFDPLDVMEVV